MFDGLSRFSIENVIKSCGYKPDNHKGRTNDVFKGILSDFEKLSIVKSSFDLSSIKPKDYLEVALNIDLDDRFVTVLPEEKEKLKWLCVMCLLYLYIVNVIGGLLCLKKRNILLNYPL